MNIFIIKGLVSICFKTVFFKTFLTSLFALFISLSTVHAIELNQFDVIEEGIYNDVDVDVLAINQEIKDILDREIRPIRSKTHRAVQLHTLMFASDKWDINYSSDRTYTAQQTFDLRLGNCMSMAALYVASARYVGLPARFQSVKVAPTFTKKLDYFLVPGHMNALVRLPRETINIEFLQTFFETDIKGAKKRVVSDKKAFAEYHNNIGMELIESDHYALAEKHLKKAVEYAPKLDFLWSNYGVIKKHNGDLKSAETMYKKALSLNKRNLSALTNLYILLKISGRKDEALKISKKVTRYNKKNPYYLVKIAEHSLNNKKYDEALSTINKAIRVDKNIPQFYHVKAKVLYAKGDHKAALGALEKAKEVSENKKDKQQFQKKINWMLSSL